ncbi:MAG: alpha-glycosidase [Lachnospiraceae bacterium]|nr:alpha-glycosidase [Lachnospiraceae bacterium]
MVNWTDSIYSDGTGDFVSVPEPKSGDIIKISVRVSSDAPVNKVFLRRMVNGAEQILEMKKDRKLYNLDYYSVETEVNEYRIAYGFIFACDEVIYFYNREGITRYVPGYDRDFVILADRKKPEWVRGAVFYQIFPERFCNGKKELDVRTGEYEYRGNKSIRMENWEDEPLGFEKGKGLDFFGGDLYGIIEKIPYLKDLGVTALYINPIFEAYSTHKYDCTDYFHVDKHFGGDEALAALSEALHKNDMKLILDISINHTGIEHKWLKEGKPFYFKNPDGSYKGWCGVSTLPMLDYRNEELCELIYRGHDSVLRKWLRPPYSIDGWRFDVADVFARNDDVQLSDKVWREVCDAIREENPEAFIIGEHWGDCAEYLQGDLWDAPMNYYGFGRIIRQFAGLGDLFLERTEELARVPYKMTAEDVVKRTEDHYSKLPQVIADCQMNLFDSHDVARMHNYKEIGFERFKSAVIAQLFWTGIPCIYYGDELAIDGYTEHDSGFRFPMPWGKKDEAAGKHLELVKKMTGLRRNAPAFAEGGRKVLYAEGRILVIARFYGKERYIGVISMEEEDRDIIIPVWTIGGGVPKSHTDEFKEALNWKESGFGDILLSVKALGSYVFQI